MELEKDHARYMNYTIKYTVGSGAQGKVKLGVVDGEQYALKFLKSIHPDLQKEMQIHKELNHPNIVKLLNFHYQQPYLKKNGTQITRSCLVYQYKEGGELFEHLAQTGCFSEQVCRYFFRQIIAALQYMHTHGIAHRDLKPENILFDGSQLMVTDLGFATFMGGRTGDGVLSTFKGTKGYMAPEIMVKQTYNGQSVDIFATGVILYVMLTGQMPFNQASSRDQLYNLICTNRQQQFWAIKEKSLGTTFSPELKLLLTSMLAFDPIQRPTISEIISSPWYNEPVANLDVIQKNLQVRQSTICAHQEKNRLQKQLGKLKDEQVTTNNTVLNCGIGKFNRGDDDSVPTKECLRKLRPFKPTQIISALSAEYLFQQLTTNYVNFANKVINISDTKYKFTYQQIDNNNEEFELMIQLVDAGDVVGLDFQLLKGERQDYYQKVKSISDYLESLLDQ